MSRHRRCLDRLESSHGDQTRVQVFVIMGDPADAHLPRQQGSGSRPGGMSRNATVPPFFRSERTAFARRATWAEGCNNPTASISARAAAVRWG